MTTGEMIDQCLDRMGAGRQSNTRLTSKILAQLNAAYATLCGLQKWDWLKARTTIDFTETDTYLALPTTELAGATVQLVSRVEFVALQDYGIPLAYNAEFVSVIQEGITPEFQARGVPRTWCMTSGTDGSTKELMLLPLPAIADTAIVWYFRAVASLRLIQTDDVPAFDAEYHQYLVEKAMSVLAPMDGIYDPQVAGAARQEAMLIYRAMLHSHAKAQPAHSVVPLAGMGQFGGRSGGGWGQYRGTW